MMRKIRTTAFIGLLATAWTGTAPARALDDPGNGRELAERWCASCHLVTPGQTRGMADVPPFSTIARMSDEQLDGLVGMLAAPHPAMPTLSLSRQEAADIAAYIRSLR